MAGFNNTPPASEFRNASSWGRTRGPKNLNGANGTQVAAPTTAVPSAATDGYATENQRYLHVRLMDKVKATNGIGIKIWGYNHAFGAWSPLTDITGTALEMKVTTADSPILRVFEISGTDRVYFQLADVLAISTDTWSAGNDELHAACSTF